jgi:hypothetical protein
VHHKRLPFSRLRIPLADFTRLLIIAKSLSGYREPACASQAAKGKPRKQITSSFSEPFANYAVYSAMYIKNFMFKILKPLDEKI